jgi:hypothetical protein
MSGIRWRAALQITGALALFISWFVIYGNAFNGLFSGVFQGNQSRFTGFLLGAADFSVFMGGVAIFGAPLVMIILKIIREISKEK